MSQETSTLDVVQTIHRHLERRAKPDVGGLKQLKPIDRIAALADACGVRVVWGGTQPAYRPSEHIMFMPQLPFYVARHPLRPRLRQLIDFAHELGHASGNRMLQGRPLITSLGAAYAREELLSECFSAMCCFDLDIARRPTLPHAKYLNGWLKSLPTAAVEMDIAISRANQALAFVMAFGKSRGLT